MIVAEKTHEFETNAQFKSKGFAIHAGAKAFNILSSNIYTNKVQAIIREYSTNAYDAHVLANVDKPFCVHLPTVYEPYFSVRDYGFGLSEEEMFDTFATYFRSTKTNTNSMVGCLGLGSCSAYSLVDAFVVNSYQSGIKKSYSAHKDESGCPTLSLLQETTTDERDGLEVIVNINNKQYEFENEAVNVYQWFDKLPQINCPTVVHRIKIQKDLYVFNGSDYGFSPNYGTAKAVMGNVAYAIPSSILSQECYIKFEIGELEFDPGREKLSLDAKTLETLKAKIAAVKEKLASDILAQIESEPTFFKKCLKYNELNVGYVGTIIQANRDKFKFRISASKTNFLIYKRGSKNTSKEYSSELPLENCEYYYHEQGYQQRIYSYLASASVRKLVLVTPSQVAECQIDSDLIKNLSTLPKVSRVGGERSKPIKVKRVYNGYLSQSEVDTTEEFVYLNMSRGKLVGTDTYTLSLMINGLEKLGVIIPAIYAISSSFPKKGLENGIYFFDFVKNSVKLPEKYIIKKSDKHRLLKHFDDRFEYKDMDDNVCVLYSRLGVKHDDSLDLVAEKYFKKYPMLQFVGAYLDDEQLKTIKEYVNELC